MALVVLAIMVAMASMDAGLRRSVVDLFGYGGPHSDEASGSRACSTRGVPIDGVKNGETYAAYDPDGDTAGAGGISRFRLPGRLRAP